MIISTILAVSYQWGVYKEETQWKDEVDLWIIIKNIISLIIKLIVLFMIVYCNSYIDEETLQHYEPRY